jgi:hypothetical protein
VIVDKQHADGAFFVNHRLGPLQLRFVCPRFVAGATARSMHQREHALGLRHVAEPLRAEVSQLGSLRQVAPQLVDGGAGQQRLASARERLEPCRPEERPPVVVVAALLDVAADERDTDPYPAHRAPVLLPNRRLQGRCGGHSVRRVRE